MASTKTKLYGANHSCSIDFHALHREAKAQVQEMQENPFIENATSSEIQTREVATGKQANFRGSGAVNVNISRKGISKAIFVH